MKQQKRTIIFLILLSIFVFGFSEPKPSKPILIVFDGVPEVLIKRGLGPKELGASLAQVLETMANGPGFIQQEKSSPQDFPELIIGIDDKNLKDQYSKIVKSDIDSSESTISLKITITDIKSGGKTDLKYSGDLEDINVLISKSGEKILEKIHPYSYAIYLYNNYRFDEALKQIDLMVQNKSSDDATFAYNLWGNYFMARGEYAHAIEKYQEAVERWPKYANAFMNMGTCYYKLDNVAKGSLMMEKAAAINPKGWIIYDNWSNGLYSKKDYGNAVEKCQKLIELRPSYAPGYNRMGLALSDSGKDKEALDYYQKATELNPEFDFAYNNWATSLLELKDYTQAEEKIKEALRIQPNSSVYLNNYGLIFFRNHHYKEAIEKFEAALKLDPGYEKAQRNLLLAKQGLNK